MTDGRLLHLRDTYPIETAWAPRYVGDELRQVRAAAWDARLAGLRAAADARAAGHRGEHDHAAAEHKLAAGYQALERAYRQRETVFAQTMADRADWDQATRAQRQLAVAADAELRRRHPGQYFSPLRSAEPEPATQRPARRPHPHPGPATRRDRPVDQGPGRRAPDLRRQARRPAEPGHPVRRPRLRRPRPGVPRLDQPGQGADLAAAQARDPAVPADPRTRNGPRRRLGGRGLTAARCVLQAGR